MPPKLSPIWEYFEEDKRDDTKVLCKVGGCKVKVSRGNTGTSKAKLSTAPMMQRLKLHHPKKQLERMNPALAERIKGDDDEIETGPAKHWYLIKDKCQETGVSAPS
jgi:hypothetical protein